MGLLDFFKKGVEKPVEKPQQGKAETSSQPASTSRTYTVKSGDSLSKIAKHFYGNANAWEKIFKANQHQIKNPDLIHPGQKIIIP